MPLVKVEELISIAKGDSDITLAAFLSDEPFGYGRVIKDENQVIKIVEEKEATKDQKAINLCNAGAYWFNTALLNSILPKIDNKNASSEYYLTDAIEIALKDGKSVGYVLVDEQNFMGINDKLALSKAENIMQNEIKSNLMKNGVIIRLPNSVFIDSRAKFEGEVRSMLDKSLNEEGFIVNEFTSQITPPESLRKTIDEKNAAIQQSLKAINEVKKAEAEAKIAIAKAEGEAKAMRIKADAEAYYNKTISASLSNLIIQENFLEKWNGVLPQVQGGNDLMPIINFK